MPTASRAPISEFVTSSDGTAIAYTRSGTGPAIVIVSGMLNDRRKLQGLAQALSMDFTVFHFDRRGRGESADCGTYSIAREIDDIAALIEAAGGSATVYGHSSGAGLAAHAASTGLPIESLVLHEPPYGPDDAESRAEQQGFCDIDHQAHPRRETRRSHRNVHERRRRSARDDRGDGRRPADREDGAHDALRYRDHGRDQLGRFDPARHHKEHRATDTRAGRRGKSGVLQRRGPATGQPSCRSETWRSSKVRTTAQNCLDRRHREQVCEDIANSSPCYRARALRSMVSIF